MVLALGYPSCLRFTLPNDRHFARHAVLHLGAIEAEVIYCHLSGASLRSAALSTNGFMFTKVFRRRSLIALLAASSLLTMASPFSAVAAGPGCVPAGQVTCAIISGEKQAGHPDSGGIVTESGVPIGKALIQINGSVTQAQADGTWSLQAPIAVRNGCGTFYIHVWAPGFVETRYSWRQCHLSNHYPVLHWNRIPLDPIYRGNLCHGHIYGLKPIISVTAKRISFHGSSSYGCIPAAKASLLQVPSGLSHPCRLRKLSYGCVAVHHLNVTLGKVNTFRASWPNPGAGSYYLEILVNDRRLALFDFPIYVGAAPTTFPDQLVKPDPLLTRDPPTITKVQQLKSTVQSLINQARQAQGYKPVALDAKVGLAAQNHAYDMAVRHFFYIHPHQGSSGNSVA